LTVHRACEIILLPGNFASAIFLPSKRNQRKIERNVKMANPIDNLIEEGKKVVHNENRCEPICSFCESDKAHYQQMSEFFDDMLEHLNFHTFVARCSRCAKASAPYVGIISGKTVFAFCVDCRDELTLKKNAAIAAQERIGA
jgi:hypothetical protein